MFWAYAFPKLLDFLGMFFILNGIWVLANSKNNLLTLTLVV